LLVLIGYGALGAVVGYSFSFLATSIIAAAFLYLFVTARHLSGEKNSNLKNTENDATIRRTSLAFLNNSRVHGAVIQFCDGIFMQQPNDRKLPFRGPVLCIANFPDSAHINRSFSNIRQTGSTT
jgi:hypothetical protein